MNAKYFLCRLKLIATNSMIGKDASGVEVSSDAGRPLLQSHRVITVALPPKVQK